MQIFSLAMLPAAFFIPSRSKHVTLGKLALLGMLVATFFLFTASYAFPGGASHYPDWALAIVHGFKLPPGVAQREVAFPLLYILSGFTLTHSFIGITLIFAWFAILISLLVYFSLEKISQYAAFYTALACIASLAPYTFMKFFYPDEAYMFFNLLACTLLIRFIQSKGNFKLLYFFTLVAVAASFTRTAGNLMFPVFLFIGYIAVRGPWRHYLLCILLFTLAAGLYQWHRYEIFDMRHQTTKPSGKGMQTIYPIYLYFKDFDVQLSPDTLGPNAKRLDAKIREGLGVNLRASPLLAAALEKTANDFKEKYVYAYTPEQLINKIWTEPNEEYYNIIIGAAGDDDKLLLETAKEIAKAYPWYIVQYSMRNFFRGLFLPPRGMRFIPGTPIWEDRSADPVYQYGERAAKEIYYFPVQTKSPAVQRFFSGLKTLYKKCFRPYAVASSIFILFAWVGVGFVAYAKFFSRVKLLQKITSMRINELVGPIFVASIFVVYENLITAVFCQPIYRYFHLTEPLRLVIASLGVVSVARVIATLKIRREGAAPVRGGHPRAGGDLMQGSRFCEDDSTALRVDWIEGYFSKRRMQWICLLVSLNVLLFAWWVISMIKHTS